MGNISIKDIANYAGVSKSTVSRVVSNKGYVSEKSRSLITQAIEKLNYQPNVLARSLVTSQSKTIGVSVPFLNTPFFASLMEGIETQAETYNYDIIIGHSKENIDKEREIITRFLERRVDGIIIIPVGDSENKISEMLHDIPSVFLMREPSSIDNHNIVKANDYQGSRNAFKYLLEMGHKRIGILKGPDSISTMRNRWKAVIDVCNENSIILSPDLVIASDLNFKSADDAAKRILNNVKDITALYTTHYWACAGLLKETRKRKIHISNDLSVSSFEAFDDWNTVLSINISANRYPSEEMGRTSINVLHKSIINNERSDDIQTVLDLEFNRTGSVKKI